MNEELERIAELEAEIDNGSDLEAKLRRYVNREPFGEQRTRLEGELSRLGRRLDHAESELKDLYSLRSYKIGRQRRMDALKQEPRGPLRILEFTEVA